MRTKSSTTAYGPMAVSIHWLSAILVLAALGSGFRAAMADDPAEKAGILVIHVPLAVGVLVLTLYRLVWWWRFDRKPRPLGNDPAWQAFAARTVHILLYVIVLGMAASGIGMLLLSGAGPVLFAGGDGPLPDFAQYPPRVPHGLGALMLVALLAFHAAAALYHHFVRRDATLKRMWFGSRA